MTCAQKILFVAAMFLFSSACGWQDVLDGLAPGGESANGPALPPTSEIDASKALFGEMFGGQFVPRSVIFASGLNPNGVEETHILASSVRNYCEHIRDGIDQERSLRVMLRVVRYVGDNVASQAAPGDYVQVERVAYFNDTLGIASPSQVPVKGASGNALTAAVARVRRGCRGQRLVAAAPDSTLTIDAHDFTGLRGHISLRFDNYGRGDSAGDGGDSFNGLPVRVGGTFLATPCPWLGNVLASDPQAPFQSYHCLPETN